MSSTWDKANNLNVSGKLRVGKGGSIVAVRSNNTESVISADELAMACDYTANVETVTATKTVTTAESGKTFFLSSGTEFVSTLPEPAAGLRYSFVVTAAPSGANYTVVSSGSSNIIKGQVYSLDVNSATDPDFEASGGDTVSFVSAKAIAGDRVDMICDGTNWFAYGFCSVFDAITITTAS